MNLTDRSAASAVDFSIIGALYLAHNSGSNYLFGSARLGCDWLDELVVAAVVESFVDEDDDDAESQVHTCRPLQLKLQWPANVIK